MTLYPAVAQLKSKASKSADNRDCGSTVTGGGPARRGPGRATGSPRPTGSRARRGTRARDSVYPKNTIETLIS